MSEPVHKLLRSLLMVWGPEATSAKRGPVWPGFDCVFLFHSFALSHFPHHTVLQVSLGLGPGRKGSGPTRSFSLFLLEGSFLYLMDVQRCSPSILNLWILESQKEGLKGSGGHKGYTSMVGTACDWRPGVALPTDIRSSLNVLALNASWIQIVFTFEIASFLIIKYPQMTNV